MDTTEINLENSLDNTNFNDDELVEVGKTGVLSTSSKGFTPGKYPICPGVSEDAARLLSILQEELNYYTTKWKSELSVTANEIMAFCIHGIIFRKRTASKKTQTKCRMSVV